MLEIEIKNALKGTRVDQTAWIFILQEKSSISKIFSGVATFFPNLIPRESIFYYFLTSKVFMNLCFTQKNAGKIMVLLFHQRPNGTIEGGWIAVSETDAKRV